MGDSGKPTSAPAHPAVVCSQPAPCFTWPVAFSTTISRRVMFANRGVAVALVLFLASAYDHNILLQVSSLSKLMDPLLFNC